LLSSNKLKKGSYLIIDEPEVNLHPEWQFKFAEILVLLAKELDITVYLNSHSPFFIEAIEAFTEFYDMQDDVNYYLTEESEVEGKYNFIRINPDELYRIYDNLGRPYDLIDQLRLRKHLGE
jgi:predicted ATPase